MKFLFYYTAVFCCVFVVIAHPTFAEKDEKSEDTDDVKVEDEVPETDVDIIEEIKTTSKNDTEVLPKTVRVGDKDVEIERGDRTVNHRVTMEISFGGEAIGNVTFGLFGVQCPKTVKNFYELSNSDRAIGTGYKGTMFHRVVRGFAVQGGDYTKQDGTGGWSIYGRTFKDENFDIKHFPFCLSMANSGKDTNASQFFVPIIRTKWLDGKHTVFGQVEKGHKVIKAINEVRVNRYNRPLGRVWISNTWREKVAVEDHQEL